MKQLKQLLLVMTIALTGFTPAQAQTTTFDHYSEWIASSRNFYVYNGSSYSNFSSTDDKKGDYWRYDDGLMYEAILDTYHRYNTNTSFLEGVQSYLKWCFQKDTSPYIGKLKEEDLDDMRPGRLVWKYVKTYGHTDSNVTSTKYNDALTALMGSSAFSSSSRVTINGNTGKGYPWQHKESTAHQVWLDGIFMGIPFWTLAGPVIGSGNYTSWTEQDFFDDAVNQIIKTDEQTYEPTMGLWAHAWDADWNTSKGQSWSKKDDNFKTGTYAPPHVDEELVVHEGRSSHCWGRALGWYAMAIMETMDNIQLKNTSGTYNTQINTLKSLFKKVIDKVIETRDPSSGVWYCVLDVGDNSSATSPYYRKGPKNNYLEATCSSMFAYCLLHGVAQGYLDNSYKTIAQDVYNSVITKFVEPDSNNKKKLIDCDKVAGLGGTSEVGGTKYNRDGSFAYYMLESKIENDSKGIGPLIWASLAAETTPYNYTITTGFPTVASDGIVQFRWSRVADDFTVPNTTPANFESPTFTAKTHGGSTLTNSSNITFVSDNTAVATVDANGTITLAGEAGTANIKATMTSGAYVGEAIYTVTTTGADTTAPTLESSTPATGATDVAVSGNIVLTFSEAVTIADASKFTLTGGSGTLNTASATVDGATITIPYSGLANSTPYTLNIDAGAVKDLSENTNEDVNAITFTTIAPDLTAPTLSSSTPANSATNVATSGTVVLTFSEAVTVANAAGITISPTTGVTWGTATVDGTDNTKVNITYSGLTNETNYTVTIANNAITDLAGNAYTGSNFSFTTRPAGSATITIGNSNSASYAATFTSSSTDEHITASATAFTLGSSTTSGSSTYSSATAPYSVKIKPSGNINTSEYSDAYSASAQFTVTSGYTFSPSTISATIVTEAANYTYQAILTDGTTTYTSDDISSSSNGVSTFVFPSLSGTALSGTVTFKIRFKSTANNSKYFVVNLPITITGTVASASPTPTTYSVTYNGNGNTSGTAPTDNTSYSSGATVTVLGNTGNLVKTGYTFNGWNTAADGNGTDRAVSSTFPISANTELFAKWTANSYTVTLNANTANHGTGENGSATATYNGTALSSITHTTAASGYARKGYYTTATEGTKVLNADGSFASANITDYITDSKWTRIGETTLYAQYEEESTLTTIPKGTTVTFTGTETLSNGMLLFNNRVQVETLTSGGSLNSSTKLENGVLSLGTNNDYLHIKVPANSKVIVNAKAGSTADNKGMYIGTSNNSTTKNYSPTTSYANYEYVSNAGGDVYIRRVSTTISIKIITVEDNSNAPSAPTFSPVSGTTVSGSQSITMSGPEGSTIYYKWDTSAPTASDLITNNQTGTSTTVESGKTLYAVAKVGEDVSSVASASYTVDSTAPTLSSSTPANDATNVAQSTSSIVLTESETVTAVGENIAGTIKIGDAEATAITFTLTNGNTLTYNLPTLSYSTTYVVKLSANQVQDGVGNQNAEQTVTITTEAAPPATYSITAISNNNTWGTVSVDPTTAAEGATVTITTTPASGYRLTNLTATDASEGNVTITNNQFTMPASAVTVNATFAAMEKVATPTITCSPASPFTTSTDVTISCGTAGSSIYYTTNGSAPTTSSTLYSAPFSISATTTVKAIAVKADMTDSDVATQTFTKSGGGSSTVLFSQDFNDATAVAYATSTARAYNKTNTLGNCVGSGKDLFTSITSVSQSASGVAINSSTGGNNRNATGIFQVIKKGNSAYWSICRTEDFATTAPTAIKVAMDFWFDNTNSGTGPGVNFAIGDDFTDGLNDSSPQNASNVHSGFCIIDNSSPTLAQYNSTTAIYNTAITEQTWLSITWVINNTGEALTYDNPTGSGTTTLNNDCYDIWLKTKAGANSTYTKVVTNQAATTASKDLQNIYIGNNVSSGKQHEFMLDNFVVTDLTPAPLRTTTATVKANKRYATYNTTMDIDFDQTEGLQAFIVDDATKSSVHLTEVHKAPASTALILKGDLNVTATDYTLYETNATTDNVTSNLLTISNSTVAADNKYYALGTVNGVQGFHRVQNGLAIPTSYVIITDQTAKSFLNFEEEENIATGIDGFATDNGFIVIDDNTPLYNLSGQRVSKDYKGIVIVNGKKVLRK